MHRARFPRTLLPVFAVAVALAAGVLGPQVAQAGTAGTAGTGSAAAAVSGSVRVANQPSPPTPGYPARPRVRLDVGEATDQCLGDGVVAEKNDAQQADLIMRGSLQFPEFPAWQLPADLTWAENPYTDDNWVSRYHRLAWVDVLRREGVRRSDQAMLDRYDALLRDWAVKNPRSAPQTTWSWFRINAAQRAIVYLCRSARPNPPDYLPNLLVEHAQYLADPADYPGKGNHALWMDQALLAIGCTTSVPEYVDTAMARLTTLVTTSIDPEGVTDEGSISYQQLNWKWYSEASARVKLCGRSEPAEFNRIELMPDLLAYALMPDGRPSMLGDTGYALMDDLETTSAGWTRTQGAVGKPPVQPYRTFAAGFAFGRSGWGDAKRAASDNAAWSIKFGAAPSSQVHGHQDLGSMEYYAYGSRLLWDTGLFAYGASPERAYAVSRYAHNVVDVPGTTYMRDTTATLLAEEHTADYDMMSVQMSTITGTPWNRRILFSRASGWLLVDDQATQDSWRRTTQRWNLGGDRGVTTSLGENGGVVRATTTGPGVNLAVRWLGMRPTLTVRKGETAPALAGWRSLFYRDWQPTPLLEASLAGSAQRYVTVFVPLREGQPDDVVTYGADLTTDGAAVSVVSGGRSERLVLTATGGAVQAGTWTTPPTYPPPTVGTAAQAKARLVKFRAAAAKRAADKAAQARAAVARAAVARAALARAAGAAAAASARPR